MSKITLTCENAEGEHIVMSMEEGRDATWASQVDFFYRFLKAQGYHFNVAEELVVMDVNTGEARETLF